MRGNLVRTTLLAFVLLVAEGCSHEVEHGHEHGQPESEQAHSGEAGHGEHGAEEPNDHGHGGHDGASEVVTRWGDAAQLFVEFPALVVGEDSAFAAHVTRLQDHFAIDRGTVIVELSGGSLPVERFTAGDPIVAGIFRPTVRPAHPGLRRVTLQLDSPAASETFEMGEFMVFSSRAEADAAASEDEDSEAAISYLLEQQWKVPFAVERVEARNMRPNIQAFAQLTLPSDAESVVTAPREGRLAASNGRFPLVGEEIASGAVMFALSTAPQEAADPASLNLAIEQAAIRTQAAQLEVDRMTPLFEQGVVSQRRLDEVRSTLSAAQAELKGARRRKNSQGQSQLVGGGGDKLDVPSPLGGVVAEMFVVPGAWVTEGQPLARIVDRDRLWLTVNVPEAYVGRLDDVSGAWFRLDNVRGVLEVPGSALVSIGTEVNPQTRTLPVRFRIDNLRRELFAGMTTMAHLVTQTPRLTVAVPTDAVVDDSGIDVVFVQLGGETFARRPVQLGIRDGAYVEVLNGIAPGEWVVGRGAWSVRLASTFTESIGHGHAH